MKTAKETGYQINSNNQLSFRQEDREKLICTVCSNQDMSLGDFAYKFANPTDNEKSSFSYQSKGLQKSNHP